ncbi:MAG: Gfo/Idh/MocA family oxidoreductase [Acholeplasmataceae bacterium]|nr:Gfo/Idh/MocA family oxidoreductase [Acholeplasmataceae bacterium]
MKIKYGMVGGDLNAFIGDVHRKAINFEQNVELTAGCFSNIWEDNKKTGDFYNIDGQRVYKDFATMAKEESEREDKINFVVIVTPNFLHFEVAKEFLRYGFNVVCEKPLCFTVEQANELESLAKEKGVLFAVTYAYSGYTMVKYAKQLIKDGKIGSILNVNAEYPQDWLLGEVANAETKLNLSVWRMDPKFSGVSNCVGDIGTHIENTVKYITGLNIKRVAAKLNNYGKALDLNANMLVEYENGVNGMYWSSQIAAGHGNGLRVRIYGTEGSLEWWQETPDFLNFTKRNGSFERLSRGNGYVYGRAAELSRIPAGHPEGYYEAFANVYKTYIGALRKKQQGIDLTDADLDFPSVSDGAEGVKFVHAVVESNGKNSTWVEIK